MRKHMYAHSFVLYGLAQLYQVTEDEDVKKWADRVFELMTRKAHDKKHGGYIECFSVDWFPADQITDFGVTGMKKTMNTHIHLLEALTLYYEVDQGIKSKNELCHLLDIILDKVYCPIDNTLGLYFQPNWVMLTERFSFGHDIETSWLLKKKKKVLTIT